MDVAHLRKQVMFDLVVESSAKPGKNLAFGSKIGGCPKLMGEGATAEVGAFELKGIEGKATLYRVV